MKRIIQELYDYSICFYIMEMHGAIGYNLRDLNTPQKWPSTEEKKTTGKKRKLVYKRLRRLLINLFSMYNKQHLANLPYY